MMYIIGVDHLIQYRNGIVSPSLFQQFKDYITRKVQDYAIELLAEEFNEEYLTEVYESEEATVKAVADALDIEHRFCDPGDEEKKRLGIPYHADIEAMVRKKLNVTAPFVFNGEVRKKVEDMTNTFSRSFWHIRERFWFNRIADRVDKEILFICGHEHVHRFKLLVEKHGVECRIINHFWKKEIFESILYQECT